MTKEKRTRVTTYVNRAYVEEWKALTAIHGGQTAAFNALMGLYVMLKNTTIPLYRAEPMPTQATSSGDAITVNESMEWGL